MMQSEHETCSIKKSSLEEIKARTEVIFKKSSLLAALLVHACNSSTGEAEAGGCIVYVFVYI